MVGVQSVREEHPVQAEAAGVRTATAPSGQSRPLSDGVAEELGSGLQNRLEATPDAGANPAAVSPLRCLLVNPPSPDGAIYIRDVNRSGRKSNEGTLWPQTSLALIAAVLDEAGCAVKIEDCIAERTTYQQLYHRMQDWKPTHVIIESVSSTIPHDMIVAHYAKYLGAVSILISPHGEALEAETRKRFPSIDHVVHYEKHEEPEYEIRQLVTGMERLPTEDFSTLPFARQDLLPMSRYDLPLIGRGYTFVLTSRGCPWKCIYCRQTVTWKSRVRYRSAETIVDEIRRYHLTNIAFHADTATVNKKQMLAICEGIRQLPWKVRWICNSRVDTVDLEMLQAMKSAGCWMVCYGIESGDDEVLRLNKKEATVADARRAVSLAKQAGLRVWGYFMLGLYGDTPASLERTRLLAQELPCDLVNFSLAAPYPGTEWGRVAQDNGWLASSRWEDYDQNTSAIVDQPGLSHQQVLAFQRKAYLTWYCSWRGVKFFAQAWRLRYARFFWTVIRSHLGW